VNSPGEGSYPIVSFSYLVLYEDLNTNLNMNQRKAQELVDFISWAIDDGLVYLTSALLSAASLGFALILKKRAANEKIEIGSE
jgi:phosphate transport system substrate-binding protein